MRLTSELITESLSFLNPLKERELYLRGRRIPTIENLAVAGPQDAIDLTDNDITQLGNIPYSPRLRTLLLARNRLTSIHSSLSNALPNLSVLVLTANNLSELADLDPLGKCLRLTHLSLLENPVARKEHYRSYVIFRVPSVRFLDFQRVRDVERQRATELFGTVEEPSPLAAKIMGIKSSRAAGTFDTADDDDADGTSSLLKTYNVKLTEKEKKRVEKMIRNAKTLQEFERIEKDLNQGRIPGGTGRGTEDE